MRKYLAWILALLLAVSSLAAADTAVRDETYANAPANSTHANIAEIRGTLSGAEYGVAPMLPTSLTTETLGAIFDFVEINQKCVAHYFPEATQQEIDRIAAAMGLTKEDFFMSEFMSQLFPLCEEADNADVEAEMKIDYAVGRPVIVLIGREGEEGAVEWRALEAEVTETNVISYTVPEDLLGTVCGRESLWAVLTVKPGAGGWGETGEIVPEFIPSKSVGDMTQTEGVYGEDGEPIEEMRILIVEADAAAQAELDKLTEHIVVNGKNVISYFDAEIQRQTGLMLPEDFDPETLLAYETMCLMCEKYIEPYGDVTARFTFATPYEDGQTAVVLLALFDEEDAAVVWTPLHAEIKDGAAEITFSATVLPTMMEETALALVLSEPLTAE